MKLGVTGWKERYYKEKFSADPGDIETTRKEVVYLEVKWESLAKLRISKKKSCFFMDYVTYSESKSYKNK